FGFRRVPSGLLVAVLIMFTTFTAYLNPHKSGHEGAMLRYIVFHFAFSPVALLIALVRWFQLMWQTRIDL
ncbi:MAG: hypothetical protein K8I82_02050, partial [Anaerolineae bacterium]|nr:hypothetical protein [Anaerolineae bacterium]